MQLEKFPFVKRVGLDVIIMNILLLQLERDR